jgi:hypothetical protein
MIELLLENLIGILSTFITVILLPLIARNLIARTDNEKTQAILLDFKETAQLSVDLIEQKVVHQLKLDGAWDSSSQKDVLQNAVTDVVNNLSATTVRSISKSGKDVREVAERYIESYICHQHYL